MKAELGTIGVAAAGFPPEADYRTPGRGGAASATIGAANGPGLGTLGAAGCLANYRYPLPLCSIALATPYFAVRYAVDQATEGVPGEEVVASEAAIRRELTNPNIQDALQGKFLQVTAT
jgi:hypothetical protein